MRYLGAAARNQLFEGYHEIVRGRGRAEFDDNRSGQRICLDSSYATDATKPSFNARRNIRPIQETRMTQPHPAGRRVMNDLRAERSGTVVQCLQQNLALKRGP